MHLTRNQCKPKKKCQSKDNGFKINPPLVDMEITSVSKTKRKINKEAGSPKIHEILSLSCLLFTNKVNY